MGLALKDDGRSEKGKGLMAALRARLERNRLGELLVGNGLISTDQLHEALRIQKETGQALGAVLQDRGLITGTGLRVVLAQQATWRALAGALAFVVGFSALGIQSARATSALLNTQEVSSTYKSYPDDAVVQPVSLNRAAPVQPARSYEPLFGSSETRSADVSPFTKWTDLTARLNVEDDTLPPELATLSGKSEAEKLEAVNSYYNKVRYIEDKYNFGKSDYWETPKEFMSRGGDCEDFAIAKYTALKGLGFSEDKLRMAIVQDTWKGLPHAILIVYTAQGAKFLDNQYKDVQTVEGFERYHPVYSINRTGWWRHTG